MSVEATQEGYRLSPMQQGMVYHHLSLDRPGLDCGQVVLSLSEPLDLAAFQDAWSQIAQRHAVLRTSIRWEGLDEPHLEIQEDVEVPWEPKDWRGLPEAAQRESLASYLRTDRQRGYDLTRAPLMRFGVLQMEDDRHEIVWSYHNALFDRTSIPILLEEAFACYEAVRTGDGHGLQPAPRHHDHASWLEQQDSSRSEAFWRERLAGFTTPTSLPQSASHASGAHGPSGQDQRTIHLSRETTEALEGLAETHKLDLSTIVEGAWALLLSHHSDALDVAFGAFRAGRHGLEDAESQIGFFMNTLPVRVRAQPAATVGDWLKELAARESATSEFEHTPLVDIQAWSEVPAGTPLFDSVLVFDDPLLNSRMQSLGGAWESREFWLHEETNFPLTLYASPEPELYLKLSYERARYDSESIDRILGHLSTILGQLPTLADRPLAELSILTEEERTQILVEWNDTEKDYPRHACFPELFQQQVTHTPDNQAVVFRGQSLTYRELNERANSLARHLQGMGVGPGTLVGICTDRSLEMVVGLLGILKSGGAYLPLDPAYPTQRLAFMLEDAGASVIVTQKDLLATLPPHQATVVCLDAEWDTIAAQDGTDLEPQATPRDLAYVIYTSGSTGKPKGVMVEHRNLVNLFAGMDDRIEHDPPGVWLAVTSLSFDISVLELFWTLARGFKVVLYTDETKEVAAAPLAHADRPMDLSLFYFASGEGHGSEKYRLVLEGAKFADRHGFEAVWTPERHFHSFGGLYPNPSVMAAAIASITERVAIRAGSVVLPLHHPIRVAEEWALADNLSDGRVGIAFASGWNPNDFVLRPESYADAKTNMFRDIETIRKLWRGESVSFPGVKGAEVSVTTLPRPVQDELPVWITTAGNPDTYRLAAAVGANILTHLLGQTVEEVAERIRIYREALEEYGFDPAKGRVTMMLHTFVGDDLDAVRETVRQPMIDYLGSALGLVKNLANEWAAFKKRSDGTTDVDFDGFSDDEMADLLAYSFERYFETSGLFGTPERCLEMIDELKGIGVDEVACLIDFGVDTDQALGHLEHLNRVREQAVAKPAADTEDHSLAAEIYRHGVTHLQCTPSTASMYLLDEDNRQALASLHTLLIGGEAFPLTLARELEAIGTGEVINMYGPTETTVWSSTYSLETGEESISIGRPIANTQLYILDTDLTPVPVGTAGELYIGGDGVVRGYLERPELTAERFVDNPFDEDPESRLYRTGDVARYRPDGSVDFLGRVDHQVKIRGHRIELGEIESLTQAERGVREAVVVAREDVPGDQRLVAYVIPEDGESLDEQTVRTALRTTLPEFMVPSHVVSLDSFPLTPNAKIDRKALPAPGGAEPKLEAQPTEAVDQTEERIIQIWKEVLRVSEVGTNDNFFDLGGHSLLAVKAHRMLKDEFSKPLAITDLFQFPTVKALAGHLGGGSAEPTRVAGKDRAELRRRSVARRRKSRSA